MRDCVNSVGRLEGNPASEKVQTLSVSTLIVYFMLFNKCTNYAHHLKILPV